MVEIVPVSISSIKWKTYIYFAIFNACFSPLIYFFCECSWEDLAIEPCC